MSFGEFYAATSGIGKAYSNGLEEYRQRGGLARLGQMIQGGDYAGAASTAFDLGDTQTGVGLLKLGQAQRQQQLEQQAGETFARGLSGAFGVNGAEPPLAALGQSPARSRALPSFADDSAPSGSYVANLFKRESGNNPNAQASTSSAKGLGQFTDKTWAGVMRSHPELGLTADGRTDPDQMLRATKAFTADNERILQRAGLPVNDSTRYASHFLGASGGPRFVAGALSNPDAPAISFVQPDQARANRRIFFNRDGSAKSAGQVMADFGASFGGGSAQRVASAPPRAPAVAYADNEVQTQALEQRMGMMPATATAEADLPAQGASEAAFYIPGTEPTASQAAALRGGFPGGITGERVNPVSPRSANPTFPPSTTGETSATTQFPTQAPSDRVMTMPGGEPASVAQEARAVQVADASGAIGNIPAGAIAQSPLGQRIPFLLRAAAMPNLPENQRQLAQTLLKQALDETRMPDGVKEYTIARSQGFSGSYLDYQRELKRPGGPTVLKPGDTVYDERANTARYSVPERNRSNVADDVDARRITAAENGLVPGSPAYQSYVLTGKMPREDEQKLTAGDKKAIQDADTAVLSAQSTIDMLGQAKELSKKAYEGPGAGGRAMVSGLWGSEGGVATQDLDNLITTQALGQLKAIFGGAPTEGERKILLDIQGSSSKPDVVRQRIYDRAIALANLRLKQNQEKAAELRGMTYYQPGSGPRGRDAGGAAPQQRALPAPSQANRPNAVPAQDRFQQLMGSGLSRDQAFERLEREGY